MASPLGVSWAVWLFLAYIWVVGSSIYRIFYPTPCPFNAPDERCVHPLLPSGAALDLFAFAAPDGEAREPHAFAGDAEHAQLFAARDVSPAERWEQNVTLPFAAFGTRANGTLFAHIYAFPSPVGGGADVAPQGLPRTRPVGYVVVPLTRQLVPRARSAKRLLHGGNASDAPQQALPAAAEDAAAPVAACAAPQDGGADAGAGSCANPDADVALAPAAPDAGDAAEPWEGTGLTYTHLRPRVTLRLAHPTPALAREAFPAELGGYVVHPADVPPALVGRRHPHALRYRPLLALDDLSVTKRDFRPVSVSHDRHDPVVPFALEVTSMGAFALYAQLSASIAMLHANFGLSEDDTDEMKEMISGSNLRWWLLTTAVSLLHGLFSYLAFSNDVGFWRGKTSLEGLSVRTFFSNFFCQCIIFLKLLDGGNVSRLILGEVGIGCLIEGWKVSKIAARRGMLRAQYWRPTAGGASDAGAPPAMTAAEAVSDEADAKAMRWLTYGLYPVVAVWGAYSLMYHTHRSWWSWAVQTAAHGVYMWGFVAMTPQLYINYRLKSVAHLPWRTMMYKVFNTFVDDVFAFAIAMPLSHRIACLRDDVIFFGYLYQRWIYPVDKTRANEFGRAYEEKPEALEGPKAKEQQAGGDKQAAPAAASKEPHAARPAQQAKGKQELGGGKSQKAAPTRAAVTPPDDAADDAPAAAAAG